MKSRDRESNRGRASEKNSIDEDRITESRPLRVEKKGGKNSGGGCVEARDQQKRDIVSLGRERIYAVPELYGQIVWKRLVV